MKNQTSSTIKLNNIHFEMIKANEKEAKKINPFTYGI